MQTTAAFHWPRMQQMRVIEKKEKSNSSTFAPAFFFPFFATQALQLRLTLRLCIQKPIEQFL